MGSMSYYTNASNSTGVDVSRLTTLENLRLAAAVLPAIAYPLLASGAAHAMLVWSAALNYGRTTSKLGCIYMRTIIQHPKF